MADDERSGPEERGPDEPPAGGRKKEGIGGPFPGGPRRPSDVEADDAYRRTRVGSGEDVEAARDRWVQERKAERRKRRLLIGALAFLIAAGGVGVWVGLDAVKSAEELVQEEERAREGGAGGIIERERERILQELWKMEDIERAPRPPGRN